MHSPFFLNALHADEAWGLWRNEQGYTQSKRVSDIPSGAGFVKHGALLGHLWMEGYFGVGDPLVRQWSDF